MNADNDYIALVKQFPIRAIRNEREHAMATAIVDRLVGRNDLTAGQRDYLEDLVRFMHDYEQERRGKTLSRLSPSKSSVT